MLKRSLFLLIILSLYTVNAAQDESTPTPTPTPDVPGYILGWEAVSLYPAALRFDLTIGRSADQIQSVILTVEIEGQPLDIIEIDVEEDALRSGDFVELVYLYELSTGNAPPFLSIVEYTWLVSLVEDENQVEVPGALLFVDPRFQWDEVEDDNIDVTLIFPVDALDSTNVVDDLRPVYNLLIESTGERAAFQFLLFPNDAPRNPCSLNEDDEPTITEPRTETDLTCEDAVLAQIFAERDATPVNVDFSDPEATNRQFLEQMIPSFYNDLWNNPNIPDWFRMGLLNFYLPVTRFGDLALLRSAARGNRLVTLNQLASSEPALRDVQSNGMVIFLADRFGVQTLFDFANTAGDTESFDTLYQDTFDSTLDALVPSVNNWLFTRSAENAFNYTPYQPTTPTPTPTESLTPFPPTPTDTPTATATITPTATVTGFLSATPLPTLTPSLTNTPRPPSITPRPAGSLLDPTATPIPTQNSSSDDAQVQQIGLLVAVAGGLLFIIAVLVAFIRGRTPKAE